MTAHHPLVPLAFNLAQLVDLSPGTLTPLLAAATLLAASIIVANARRKPFLARIGLRNAARRRVHSGLIVGGLMLATMFISAALTLDDTIVRTVKGVAIFSLGRVDEEVVGGSGPLGLYPQTQAIQVREALKDDAGVAGVAPALALPDVLVVDQSTRQVRGDVLGVAIDPTDAGPLADLTIESTGVPAPVTALAAHQVYLNSESARLLNARTGDTLYLYSGTWAGTRYEATVLGVVRGGPLAERPSILLSLPALQELLGSPGHVNRIYIANAGDGLSGVGLSDEIAAKVRAGLPKTFRVNTVKQDGVTYALQAQDIFGRILTLYTLFALSIGLLLIFLIFTLLAAERRTELGMARAMGMQRADVIWMLLFEGAAYDLLAAAPGLLAGLGLGTGIIVVVRPTVERLGLPLQVSVEPRSVLLGLCVGLLFTLITIVLAVGIVTQFTVAAALRDLPEPPPPAPPLGRVVVHAVSATRRLWSRPRAFVTAWLALLWALVERGILPLAASALLLRRALDERNSLLLSLALSGLSVGALLALRALALGMAYITLAKRTGSLRRLARLRQRVGRFCTLMTGVVLVVYWSLPFDVPHRLGLPRYTGGIELFFASGVMMVLGAVLAIAPNLDVLLMPFHWLARRVGRSRRVAYLALVYPAQQRLRTGISLAMFSLVCFTMVVMTCIAASTTERYANLDAQSGGYDVIGQPLFHGVGGSGQALSLIEANASRTSRDITAVSTATPLPLLMLQPAAKEARWGVYPAAAITGAFLDGMGLPLVARAPDYATDADVWRALREEPGTAVIDTGALSAVDLGKLDMAPPALVSIEHFVAPPIASGLLGRSAFEALLGRTAALGAQNRVPADVRAVLTNPRRLQTYALQLHDIVSGPGSITPTTLWIADPRGGTPATVRIIGVVANTTSQHYGLLASPATFASVERNQPPFAGEFYFFRLRPDADIPGDARAISSALLDYGFETTVIRDALLDVNGPAVFASRVLVALVAFTLLVGMAALAVTGTRAVVERRQQIGMLRALGYRRRDMRRMFALEAMLTAGLGALVGLELGLVLCRNAFAVSFFEQFQSGLALVIPWPTLGLILR